jgi:hypothetical protein
MPFNSLFRYFGESDIFISYRWTPRSKQYALRLSKELDDRGLTCYVDETELPVGENVPASLSKAIRKSKMFILLATDDLEDPTSKWVPKELALAHEFSRKIVPVNIGGGLDRISVDDARWLPLKESRTDRREHRRVACGRSVRARVGEDLSVVYLQTLASHLDQAALSGRPHILCTVVGRNCVRRLRCAGARASDYRTATGGANHVRPETPSGHTQAEYWRTRASNYER